MDIDLTGLVLPERIEMSDVSEDGRSAEFVMEPLERGYGHTLGNAVRRVLLSSLPGAAVWAFRMEGRVQHEHQTIPAVVEDVHQVIQNFKSLVLKLDPYVDEKRLTVEAREAGPVTAANIRESGGVTILNPDHHFLTLQESTEFSAELWVDKGRGFVLAEQHELPPKSPVDLVRIDAIYNPVRRANFTVQETRVGQRTDFDRLTVRVETDGSVEAVQAVQDAAELIRRHLKYMFYFKEGGPPVVKKPEPVLIPQPLAERLKTQVDDLAELSVRSRNALYKQGIHTLMELVNRTESEMLDIDNFGRTSLDEIHEFLRGQGLRFGMKIEERDDGSLYWAVAGAAAAFEAEALAGVEGAEDDVVGGDEVPSLGKARHLGAEGAEASEVAAAADAVQASADEGASGDEASGTVESAAVATGSKAKGADGAKATKATGAAKSKAKAATAKSSSKAANSKAEAKSKPATKSKATTAKAEATKSKSSKATTGEAKAETKAKKTKAEAKSKSSKPKATKSSTAKSKASK